MSKIQKKPKPGAELGKQFDLVAQIDTLAHDIGNGNEAKIVDLKKLVDGLPSDLSVDSYRFLIERLAYSGSMTQQRSDKDGQIALVLEQTVNALKGQIIEQIRSENGTFIEGETWRFDLEKLPSKITIDIEKLPAEYVEEKIVKRALEAEIITDMNDGMKIAGVMVEPVFDLIPSVIKKKPTNE
jgi:hypothetical protein